MRLTAARLFLTSFAAVFISFTQLSWAGPLNVFKMGILKKPVEIMEPQLAQCPYPYEVEEGCPLPEDFLTVLVQSEMTNEFGRDTPRPRGISSVYTCRIAAISDTACPPAFNTYKADLNSYICTFASAEPYPPSSSYTCLPGFEVGGFVEDAGMYSCMRKAKPSCPGPKRYKVNLGDDAFCCATPSSEPGKMKRLPGEWRAPEVTPQIEKLP